MNDDDIENWVESERIKVAQYLERQGIIKPNVGSWPAFEIAPYFAIWAIESKRSSGKIGWWAFSGDIPTDYVSEDGKCHPRNALSNLLLQWNNYIPFMKSGRNPPDTNFGDEADLILLGGLLEKRIKFLTKTLQDDSLWEDR
jgi:hypothetical protein